MGRKKKKRQSEDAPRQSAAEAPEVTRAAEPEPGDAGKARPPHWPQSDSAARSPDPAAKPAYWSPAPRPSATATESPTEAEPFRETTEPGSLPEERAAEAAPGFFARLAGWWQRLTGPGEGVELHVEPGAPPAPVLEEPVLEVASSEVAAPLEPGGPIDADPIGTLESSLRLAAGLEKLQGKLQNREKHLESLREQRNDLHQQLSREREATEGRIRTLEVELTELRSHAEEPAPQLQEALDASAARIQALEAELAETRDHATTAQAALAAQESRLRALEEEIARMNAPIEEALEQYRLEKEATWQRMRSLEADLGAAREQAGAAETRAQALDSDLNEARARVDAAEGRAAALETELEHSRAELNRSLTELEAARAATGEMAARAEAAAAPPREWITQLDDERRLSQELGQKAEELARRLAETEQQQGRAGGEAQRELEQSQQEARRALGQMRDLEAALQQAEQLAHEREAELVAVKRQLESLEAEAQEEEAHPARKPVAPPAGRAEPAPVASGEVSAQVAAELYKQALTPLTVIVASADMLVMSLKDPSLKESAQDIKFQTQALMELLKKAAQPPEKK